MLSHSFGPFLVRLPGSAVGELSACRVAARYVAAEVGRFPVGYAHGVVAEAHWVHVFNAEQERVVLFRIVRAGVVDGSAGVVAVHAWAVDLGVVFLELAAFGFVFAAVFRHLLVLVSVFALAGEGWDDVVLAAHGALVWFGHCSSFSTWVT